MDFNSTRNISHLFHVHVLRALQVDTMHTSDQRIVFTTQAENLHDQIVTIFVRSAQSLHACPTLIRTPTDLFVIYLSTAGP